MRRILIVSFLTFAPLLLAGCPKGNADYKAGRKAELAGDLDTAVVDYDKAVKRDPMDAEFKLHAMRARFNDGQSHVQQGEKALQNGQLEVALSEFQKAKAIDPSSEIADQEAQKTLALINKTNAAEQPKTAGATPPEDDGLMSAPPVLKPLSREPINLNSTNTARFIYDAIGKIAGISVIYTPDFGANGNRQITVQLLNVTLEQALDAVALQTKTFWKPVTGNIILVAPDDVQHRHDLEDEEVQTFYLHNSDTPQELTEASNLLRTVLDIQKIVPINSLNAIVVRATPDRLILASKVLDSIDKAKPEVVIQVDVLETDVDRLHDLGILPGQSAVLQFTPGSALQPNGGSSGTGSNSSSTGTGNQVTLGNIRNLSANDWSATLPGAALTAIMTDTTTKIIQNPTLRMSDGAESKLHIGDKVPYASGSFQAGLGVSSGATGISPLVNTQFNYQEVGVKMDITPRIHPDGDVTLKESIDVSSVTGTRNIGGVDEPVISERSIEDDVRLKDGETDILGGLIDQQTVKILNGWPGVAHIPFLKYFFSDDHRETTDSEVLIALTPHIVRMPDITADDMRTIASGTDTNVRVYEKDEATAPPPPPTQTQAQNAGPDGSSNAAAAPAQTGGTALLFQPDTVSLKAGDTVTVELAVKDAHDLFSIPLLLQYDPAVIQVTDIRNGGFLSGGTEDIAVVHQENQQQGQAVVSATRQPNTPGINGAGNLLDIVIKAIAPGTSPLRIVQVNARDSQQRPITMSAGSATIRVQ